tara:strand:+ start:315 stop:692 length:378 start_codon:yes stop_codon:yes gene_type:complete
MKMNLSEVLNAINYDKTPLLEDDLQEKSYVPFVINRSLSYFPDTILYANQVNHYNQLDKKMQFDYLRLSLRPRKRFSKWIKSQEEDDLQLIKDHYNYSNERATEVLRVLTPNQIEDIRSLYKYGG